MTDKANRTRQLRAISGIIHMQPKMTDIGESRSYTTTLGQINAARRRNALKQVRELIREFEFTLDEIERDAN